MDFPKSVPSVGLVDGKFIDEDPLAGTPGSLIPSAWGNAVTLEILKVIEDGGLVPDEDDKTQLSAAIKNIITDNVAPFATKSEAEDGSINDKSMSPLRVFQAIAKVVTQATEEAFGWLKIGTQTQVNTGTDDAVAITPKKLAAATRVQAHTAFTSAGTSTALTLAPSPAITVYAPNQRFSVNFHTDSGLNPTLNVSAKGQQNLKQYDSAGAKVAAKFAANQVGDIVFDGTDFVLLNAAPPVVTPQNLVGVRGAFSELAGSASGTSASASWTAKEIEVMNAAGAYKTLRNVNVTISLAASGLNGLDTGASAISTWYYAYVIWNETSGVVGGIYSLSAAVPALPAGFTHYARIGAVRSDAVTANKFPCAFTQQGNKTTWTIAPGTNMTFTPSIAFGLGGSLSAGGVLAANVGAFVPPTSAQIILFAYNTGGSTLCAPSNAFGNVSDPANPVPIIANPAGGSFSACIQAEMLLKSSSIYWAANGSNAKIGSVGWVDNL